MKKTGFDQIWGGTFRYPIRVPVEGLSWDEAIGPAPGLVSNVEPAYLKAPWLVGPPLRFNEIFSCKVPPSFHPPELLRRFARLPLTQEAIGRFANTFGFLGEPLPVCYPTSHQENMLKFGESFHFWKEEIDRMSFLLTLWDAIQAAELGRDVGFLARCIIWNHPGEPKHVRIEWSAPEKGLVKSVSLIAAEWILPEKEMLLQWKHNDMVNPARYYLNKQIDARLKDHVKLFVSDDDMYMQFDSLLAALYSSFKWEVLGKGYAPKFCLHCGEIFTPTRIDQKYHRKCQKNANWHRHKGEWRERKSDSTG
jgi:hypothetical protein